MNKAKQRNTGILYMIEDVDIISNKIVLANYIFDKKVSIILDHKKIKFYAKAFYSSIERNMFIFLEFDEEKNKIVAN